MTHLPKFSPALLHPCYWSLWLDIGLLWLVVQLPYPLIYRLGNVTGRPAMHFMKRRAKITYRNPEFRSPEESKQERHRMMVMNSESAGMGLMETGMAWFWLARRITRWIDTISFGHIRDVQAQQRGILLIGIHFLTLEIGARMSGMNELGIGVYRPNDNPAIDWLQTWGRLRSDKDMTDRKDLKGMIRALKKGEVIWYVPDHDYGSTASTFAPLLVVDQTATISGTWMLAKMFKACIVPFAPRRRPGDKGYELIILPPECSSLLNGAEAMTAWMNKTVEQCIMMTPEQYMWLHRHLKACPEGMPFRY